MHILHMPTHQRTCILIAVLDHQELFKPFHNVTFEYYYIWLYKLLTQHHLIQHLDDIMNATDYCPHVREYSIWNATVAPLQFWKLILNLTSSVAPLNESMPHSSILLPCTCYATNLMMFYLVTS